MRCRILVLVIAVGAALVGTAVPAAAAAAYTLTPASLAFGNVTVGSTVTRSTVVKNSGTTNLQIKATLAAGRFALANVTTGAGSCLTSPSTGLNLAPGDSCTVAVAFTPNATGAVSDKVTVYGLPATGAPGTHSVYATTGTPVVKPLGLSGTGAALTATVTPTSLAFGNVENGSSKVLRAKVTNTSTIAITVSPALSGASEFREAPYAPVLSDACTRPVTEGRRYQVVPPGESCDVEVSFRPTTTGARSGTATLAIARVQPGTVGETGSPAPSELTKTVALTGSGVLPPMTLTPTSLAFGSITEGSFKSLTVKVANTSKASLQFWPDGGSGDFSITGTTASDPCSSSPVVGGGMVDDRPITIPAGDSCLMQVSYLPHEVGADKASLTIGAYTPATPPVEGGPGGTRISSKTLAVSGTGIAPTFAVSPTTAAVGNVTVSSFGTTVVKVTNTSGRGVQFWPRPGSGEGVFGVGPGAGVSGAPACEHDLPGGMGLTEHVMVGPGASCSFQVSFFPRTVGAASAPVIIDAYGGGDYTGPFGPVLATKTMTATGTGKAPAVAALPASVAFGNVTVNGTRYLPVDLVNNSDVAVQFWPGTAAAPFGLYLGSCFTPAPGGMAQLPVTISPGERCTATAVFSPSATGAKSGTVTVDVYGGGDHTGPSGPRLTTKSIAVSGTGVVPTMTVSPTSIAFGTRTTSTFNSRVVTVTNTSDVAMEFGATVAGASSVTVTEEAASNGCASSGVMGLTQYVDLAPGQSCTVVVNYVPLTAGAHSATVTVEGHGPGGSGSPYEADVLDGPALVKKTISVTGTGKALSSTVSPTSLSFGSVKVGLSKTLKLTMTNTSTVAVRYQPSGPGESPFQVVGGGLDGTSCLASTEFGPRYLSVAPGATCSITVRFSPWAVGSRSGTYRIGLFRSSGSGYGGLPGGSAETVLQVRASGTGA